MSIATITEPLVIGPEDNGLLMTPEEFDAITEYDENYRYELINGVLIVNAIPGPAERDPNEELGRLLRNYQDEHLGVFDKTLSEEYIRVGNSRRRADRVIWAGLGRTPDPKVDVPTIAIEFVSRSRRDRRRDYEIKRDEYLAAGIREYWVFDRFERTLTVFRPDKKGYKQQVLRERDTYRTNLLPGFGLSLASLFDVADDWEDS